MPPVRLKQDQRRAGTRASLLEAAARLFAEHGIDGVSVDAVAEAAGRTSGAVYDHFSSKHGLLMAVLDQWSHALERVVVSELESAPRLEDRLRAVALTVVLRPDEQTRLLLLLERELALRAARDPRVATALAVRLRQSHQRLTAGFAAWEERGLLPPDAPPPEVLAVAFRALVLDMELRQRIDPESFTLDRATAVLAAALHAGAGVPQPA